MVQPIEYLPGLGISEHACMLFNLHIYTPITGQAQTKFRYHMGKYNNMNDHLNKVDWSLMDNMSLQESWLFFYTTYEKAMDQFIPKSVGSPEKAVDESYSSNTTQNESPIHG